MDSTQPTKPPRARFSILTLLLLTAIVALTITVVLFYRELEPLRSELKKLREETGQLTIVDPSKIHAIRLPTEDDEPRRYRIYLPPGATYNFNYQANRIPKQGVGEFPNPHQLQPGEYLVGVELTRRVDKETGEPISSVDVRLDVDATQDVNSGFGASIGIGQGRNDWIVNKETGHMSYSWQELAREQEVFDASEQVVVYRARAETVKVTARDAEGKPRSWSTKTIETPCEGFMVWIEAIAK